MTELSQWLTAVGISWCLLEVLSVKVKVCGTSDTPSVSLNDSQHTRWWGVPQGVRRCVVLMACHIICVIRTRVRQVRIGLHPKKQLIPSHKTWNPLGVLGSVPSAGFCCMTPASQNPFIVHFVERLGVRTKNIFHVSSLLVPLGT